MTEGRIIDENFDYFGGEPVSQTQEEKEQAKEKFLTGLKEAAKKAGELEEVLTRVRKDKKARGQLSGINVANIKEEDLKEIAINTHQFQEAWNKVPFKGLQGELKEKTQHWGHDLSEPICNPYISAAGLMGLDIKKGEDLKVNSDLAEGLGFVLDPVFPKMAKLVIENFCEEVKGELNPEIFNLWSLDVEVARLLYIRNEYQDLIKEVSEPESKIGKLRLRMIKPEKGPLFCQASKGAIARALLNVLGNGIKSTRETHCLKGEEGLIMVVGTADDKQSEIATSDYGSGVDIKAILKNALASRKLSVREFGRMRMRKRKLSAYKLMFEGVSGFIEQGFSGSGSGMQTTKRIVEEAKGKVYLINNEEGGCTNYLRFPLVEKEVAV